MVVKETLEVLSRSTSSCCSSHFKSCSECVPRNTSDDENAEPGKSVSALTLDLVEKDTQDARAAIFSISRVCISTNIYASREAHVLYYQTGRYLSNGT